MSENTAETVAALAMKSAQPVVVAGEDGRRFLVTPQSAVVKDVTDPHGLMPRKPAYIHQSVTVQALDSLVEYVNRFKGTTSMLFADIDKNSIAGALDYHGPGGAEHVAHRVIMVLPFAQEWVTWTKIDGALMGQLEFARFLEENHPDIAQPNAAELIEMSRDLHAARNIKFTKVVRTDSDNESLIAEDTTTLSSRGAGNSLELPRQFTLRIPVYFGESTIDMTAFLRWKVGDEGMKLGVKMWRPEHVRQAMFKDIVARVADQTGLPIVFGRVD